MTDQGQLIFIYNADSSPFHQALDFFSKLVAPQLYPCNLHKLTHDGLNMKKEWQEFVKTLPYASKFYHRDMFKKKCPVTTAAFPATLVERNGHQTVLITAEEITGLLSLDELKKLILVKLSGVVNE